ncbi:serine hydrolase [Flavobacterium sp. LC2016-23]|uniref:serine hydrolase n=1 Tax=Flavobacterium sp. LC2016-23 TaxID=2666330 RepID=UPI0012AFB6EA|nr:serine hydrolase [Flavobacterium sp. LC2016-23]MRX41921.1 serine hydrolase [Flavobacterium sp. LC2016-23]
MTKYILITILFLSLNSFAQNINSSIDDIVHREMKERRIPGLQIAVVQNDKIVLSKSYGLAYIQDSIPVKNNTIFPINSNTKVFTATAIMQLVEQGKVELDAPINKYLDYLPPLWQKITVEQLLTHISGLPDILKLIDAFNKNTGSFKNENDIWEKLKTTPLDFETGSQFSYNQTNYYLLSKIIEKQSGQSFQNFLEEKQFNTVGLKQTLFGDSRDIILHYAPTYKYRNFLDGKKLVKDKLINDYYVFPDFSYATAGLNSTAEDMAKWIIALQNKKLLKNDSTLNLMWSPANFNNGKPTNWTRGWGIAKLRKKHKAVGMSGGGRSAFLVYPDDKLAVIVFTNLGGSNPEDFLEELAGVYNPEIIRSDAITHLRKNLNQIGYDKAVDFVKKESINNPDFNLQENEINDWAYRLLVNKPKEALEIFKLTVFLFPESWNAYDSYGEALLKMENKTKAIEMYKKSIELNPQNENGKKILEKINSK